MQRDNAATHIVVVAMAEAGCEDHTLQGLLIGMHADGFDQIAIALGVAGHGLAEQRQGFGIGVIQGPHGVSRPRLNMALLMSVATTRPTSPTRSAKLTARSPVPEATSSTR